MSRRIPGATESERLSMSTVKDEDQLTTRHNPGTLDDVDLGLSKAILQSDPVVVCTSAAQTIAKTASLAGQSFPDFKLLNGRKVIVYMQNANTAENPTLNVANTGAIPLDGDYWDAGTFLHLQYVDITVNGTRIQRWIVQQGANNVKSQLNGALANYYPVIIGYCTVLGLAGNYTRISLTCDPRITNGNFIRNKGILGSDGVVRAFSLQSVEDGVLTMFINGDVRAYYPNGHITMIT